ncbi:hypothetical protein VHEMI02756 [[Torrubiella] hemipterigena]|uniref:Zn(2)-C6 fungal-type domain-containing protein n=1 Tax=[Torrubiella] hemipterigena TaxID=1531966 RepID=A0A0A1T8W5_9HYPO|nr:hypothetical protein VHEMI02756 [[Torrubiella] hemipterigena]
MASVRPRLLESIPGQFLTLKLSPASTSLAPRRAKRFAPKSRAGCLVCRKRRIKCDEERPRCKRCVIGRWECQYAKTKEPLQPQRIVLLQPATYLCPAGIHPEGYEIDLFGTFRSSLVSVVGGAFNREFWRIDVPTAAQVYPSIWHGAVALTAIYKSIKVDKKSLRRVFGSNSTSSPTRNQLYQHALVHFNKSIQALAKSMASCPSDLSRISYRDKEMIIMTVILYIGLCGMLSDDHQLKSQCESFSRLLEAMQFGEEDPVSRNGIMSYNDLLSIILIIDVSIYEQMGLPGRWTRKWTVQCPQIDSFTCMTDAYLAMLPTQFLRLFKYEDVMAPSHQGSMKTRFRLDMLESYVARLGAFKESQRLITPHDRQTLEILDLIMELSFIREEIILAETRDEAIAANEKMLLALDKVDAAMGRMSSLGTAFSLEPPPYIFAPSLGRLLQIFLAVSSSPKVRRRGVELMRKWPYSEVGIRSDEAIAIMEIVQHHVATGPARTLPYQQSGLPILSSFKSNDGAELTFDPLNSCECIPDVFICRDHKMGDYEKDVYGPSPRYGIVSWYELRHNLPHTWYPFPY